MKKFTTSIMILLIAFGADTLFSQDNPLAPQRKNDVIYFGPVLGYNRSMHSTDYNVEPTVDDGEAPCPSFTEGNENGFFFGLTGEYPLGDIKGSKSSIIAKIVYSTMPAYLEVGAEEGELPSLVDNVLLRTDVNHAINLTYNLIATEIIYKFNFAGAIGVTVGPTIDFALAVENEQVMEITGPDKDRVRFLDFERFEEYEKNPTPELEEEFQGVSFNETGRVRTVDRNFDADVSNFRLGLKVGLQYTINLEQLIVVPHLTYNFGITNLSTKEDWRVSAIQAGFDVRWAFKY